jgi:hypothetical protein
LLLRVVVVLEEIEVVVAAQVVTNHLHHKVCRLELLTPLLLVLVALEALLVFKA